MDLGELCRDLGDGRGLIALAAGALGRVLPYWEGRIVPELKAGKRVLISAHGNSLRALVKHLSGIPDDAITTLEIPTGQPIVYELDDNLAATNRYYLSER